MYSSSVLDLIVFTKELLFVFQPSSFCDFGGLCFVLCVCGCFLRVSFISLTFTCSWSQVLKKKLHAQL